LRSLQRHGPQGPRRALRDHGHHRGAARTHHQQLDGD
jgi:hypothetical protein